MISEFGLIQRYFTRAAPTADLGVGDDAALLRIPEGHQLVVSTDMLVCGRHFFEDVRPEYLGHKCLAVNLSDMAAMGATPRWFTLSLSLPKVDEEWLGAFSQGLFALAEASGTELVGGDTTSGPLNICVQFLGVVPVGQALLRSGARPGDDIWVSGTLGDSALGLVSLREGARLTIAARDHAQRRLETPMPRTELGIALRGLASAAIDVSDGLLADLGHILERSKVGAVIEWEEVPRSAALRECEEDQQRRYALSGGDDYELCFTAPSRHRGFLDALGTTHGCPVTRIGVIQPDEALLVRDRAGQPITLESHGYDHFV
ncbi:MAG: thiamine-phosphate kinase [Betaproteobacteria bacterium]|nr:thiamine-phosphate kinase [Betaproteobacteria bacterium]